MTRSKHLLDTGMICRDCTTFSHRLLDQPIYLFALLQIHILIIFRGRLLSYDLRTRRSFETRPGLCERIQVLETVTVSSPTKNSCAAARGMQFVYVRLGGGQIVPVQSVQFRPQMTYGSKVMWFCHDALKTNRI